TMQTSAHTESTRLSGTVQSNSPASPHHQSSNFAPKTTPRSVRSIGIQLNSPALGVRRTKMPVSSTSIQRSESPNLSFIGIDQDDFEYDYYDLLPSNERKDWKSSFFETNIDIDDIIDQSDLMKNGRSSNESDAGPSSPQVMVSVS